MNVSVILATYNEPEWLEKVLWGYAVQSHPGFELIVADDGSGPETRRVIERFEREAGRPVRHVRHADRGYRKCEILNRAVLAARGEYLIFSDGDCIPRSDFVAVHLRHTRPGRFLSGGALRLSRSLSERIGLDDVRAGRIGDPRWLRARGWKPGRRRLRLLRFAAVAGALDAVTPTRATWNGGNASAWREDILAVNGFNHEMKYGGQDREFGARLANAGLRGRQIRHRAVCLHLEHERPYRRGEDIARNRAARRRIRRTGETWAPEGLSLLTEESESTTIDSEAL